MASPAVTTTYILTVTNLTTSCENTDTVTVFVNPLPPVTLPAFGSVCIGDSSFVLTGGNPLGGTYSGTGVYNGFFHPDSAGIGPHTIIYTYIDSNLCADTAIRSINVNALPTVTLSPIPEVCHDVPAFVLTGGNPLGGTYNGNGITGNVFDPATAGIGIYTITYSYTDSNFCSNTAQQILSVNPLPFVNLGTDTTICIYHSIQLNAGAGNIGYLWSTGDTSQTLLIDSNLISGIYSVFVIDSNGCTGFDTIEILFDPCTGIQYYTNNHGVNIYPNPNHGVFKIVITNINNKDLKYILYDLLGKMMINETVTDIRDTKFEKEIHLSVFNKGIYILKVKMGNDYIIKKVLVE